MFGNIKILFYLCNVLKTARLDLKSIKVAQVQKAFAQINSDDFKIEVVEKLQKCEKMNGMIYANDKYKAGKEICITIGKKELTYHTSDKFSAWKMTCWLETTLDNYISKIHYNGIIS